MQKCIGRTATGKQCTRNADKDGGCWQHKGPFGGAKRVSNSNIFIASIEEYINYAPIKIPSLTCLSEAYMNRYDLAYFPFLYITNDAQYELIYQMNVRTACRLFRTCKLLYQFWVSKHETSAENNQMWFNLCILNELIPHSIDLSEEINTTKRLVLPKKFVDWKACCITRYIRSLECANCHYVHTGRQVYPRGTCNQFIKTVFIDYK